MFGGRRSENFEGIYGLYLKKFPKSRSQNSEFSLRKLLRNRSNNQKNHMEIVLFALLVTLSAFFSATETAFFSLHQSRIRIMKQKKRKNAAIIQKLKSQPQRLLITILIGNNAVNLFTAAYATVIAGRFFGSAALGVATGAATFFILVFGEIIPKSFAYSHN